MTGHTKSFSIFKKQNGSTLKINQFQMFVEQAEIEIHFAVISLENIVLLFPIFEGIVSICLAIFPFKTICSHIIQYL